MRLLTVDGHWRVRHDMPRHNPDIEVGLVIETPRRWARLFAVYGEAPGSRMMGQHLAVWPIRSGGMRGWCLRTGWWPAPCITVLAHTRPARDVWAQVAYEDQITVRSNRPGSSTVTRP